MTIIEEMMNVKDIGNVKNTENESCGCGCGCSAEKVNARESKPLDKQHRK